MRRWLFFVYGVVCYLLFLATFAYMAGFVGNFLVPKIDRFGRAGGPIGAAVAIDLLLLGAVRGAALGHGPAGVQARLDAHRAASRSSAARTCWLSCVVTILLMWQWRGIDAVVWDVQQPVLRGFVVGPVCGRLAARAGRSAC